MEFDYFYGRSTETFRFVRLPLVLLEEEVFKNISVDAKVLYSLYLSRSSLSYKNRWIDEEGKVFIYFTVEEVSKIMNCGMSKAVKLIKALEEVGLIEKKRQGQGKPTIIYVKDFMSIFYVQRSAISKIRSADLSDATFKTCEEQQSRLVQSNNLDCLKATSNYIENNKIENNKIDFSYIPEEQPKRGMFQNVDLTDEQVIRLKESISNLDEYIERLSAFMQSTGKAYKDHAATIMTWYLKDKQEGKAKTETTFTGIPSDYDSEWNLNN